MVSCRAEVFDFQQLLTNGAFRGDWTLRDSGLFWCGLQWLIRLCCSHSPWSSGWLASNQKILFMAPGQMAG
jgi:hypothetical protein